MLRVPPKKTMEGGGSAVNIGRRCWSLGPRHRRHFHLQAFFGGGFPEVSGRYVPVPDAAHNVTRRNRGDLGAAEASLIPQRRGFYLETGNEPSPAGG